jgi:hypothetical protein
VVFYNDLDSDRAGVLVLAGGQWRPGKALHKYDPAKGGDGTLIPGNRAPTTPPGQAGADDPRRPGPNQPGQPQPGQPQPGQPRPGQPQPGQPRPGQPQPGQPGERQPGQDPGQPGTDQGGPGVPINPGAGGSAGPPGGGPGGGGPPADPPPTDPGTGPPPPPQVPVINSLVWSPDPAGRDQPVTFSADVVNATGATWRWVIVDPASGATLQQAITPDQATFTLPAGSPASLEIRLDVRTEAGAAPTMIKRFTTTASVAPQITELTPNPADPSVGQQVAFHAVESRAGNRASWAWVVDGPTGTNVPPQVAPGVDLPWQFTAVGDYTVTLAVTFDGVTDRRSTTVTVADRASLTALSGSPVDLRSGARTVSVRLDNSFVAQTVQVTKAAWLSVSDTSIPVQPGGTASVSVSVTGTPPGNGVQPGALTFRLSHGSTVSYDVEVDNPPVNTRPVVLGMTCVTGTTSTTFIADVRDEEPGSLNVVAHVGSMDIPLLLTTINGNQARFAATRAIVQVVDDWTVDATDSGGLIGTLMAQFVCV